MHTTIKLPARKLVWMLFAGIAIVLAPQFAPAANRCNVQVSPVTFPVYNPLIPFDTQTHGAVIFNCTQSSPITVMLGTGEAGSVAARRMMSGASQLNYNLFLDAAGQVIWGDGTGGSQFYSNSSPPSGVNVTLSVYARIPARQTKATPGIYKDTIVVTILY